MTRTTALLDSAKSYSPLYASILAIAAVLGLLTVAFGTWTATCVCSFPVFLAAVVFLMYFPGKFLLDATRLGLLPLEDLTLSLLLGMTTSSVLYWISAFLAIPGVFVLWPVVATVTYFYRQRDIRPHIRAFHLPLDLSHLLLIGTIVLGLIPLFSTPIYYRDYALAPHGTMTFTGFPDSILHLSIANELTHSIPPQVPFLAGTSLRYHYGMDLVAAMISNTFGLSTLDLTVRFLPTLFLIEAMLSVVCFSRACVRSNYWAVLITFLVFFGEDFSFIPGLVLGSQADWSAGFFGVPTTFSLYFINPMLPGLGILFTGLFCLLNYCRRETRLWLVLTAWFIVMLMQYKIFAAAHVVASLAIAGCAYYTLFRDARLLRILAGTSVLAIPFVVHSWFGTEAGAGMWVRVAPWPYMPAAISQLGLSTTSLGKYVSAAYAGGPMTPNMLGAVFLVALPVYLLASAGLRFIAVPVLLKELFRPRSQTPVRLLMAVFVLLGPLITLTWAVTPTGYPPLAQYNNSVWFYVQSKYVAWVFAVEPIMVLWPGKSRFLQIAVLSLVVGLSIPSTVQHFSVFRASELPKLDRSEMELVGFLKEACSRGEVALSRQESAVVLLAMTNCRVPVAAGLYATQLTGLRELQQRSKDRDDFWAAWNQGELRTDILDRYKVAYVVVDKKAQSAGPVSSVGQDRLTLAETVLRPRYENRRFVVYQVRS